MRTELEIENEYVRVLVRPWRRLMTSGRMCAVGQAGSSASAAWCRSIGIRRHEQGVNAQLSCPWKVRAGILIEQRRLVLIHCNGNESV